MRARPALALAAVAAYLAALLWADRYVGLGGQILLGLVTVLALVVALRAVSPERRAQTLVVVAVATCGEIVGSIVWGLYTYRLENLPAFVPPAHGLVYLGGVALAGLAAGRERLLVGLALVAVLSWGVAGVTVLPREDLGGLLGAAAARGVPAPRPRAGDLRGRVRGRRRTRALRHGARHVALGRGRAGDVASPRATRRAASPRATSSSTSPRWCSRRWCWAWCAGVRRAEPEPLPRPRRPVCPGPEARRTSP